VLRPFGKSSCRTSGNVKFSVLNLSSENATLAGRVQNQNNEIATSAVASIAKRMLKRKVRLAIQFPSGITSVITEPERLIQLLISPNAIVLAESQPSPEYAEPKRNTASNEIIRNKSVQKIAEIKPATIAERVGDTA